MKRQLISSEEAVKATHQHKKPCSDCPFARTALNGWLGGLEPEDWVRIASSEGVVPCHTQEGAQCAGIAIYRRNTCKLLMNKRALVLPKDTENVFSNPMEFLKHHKDSIK